LYISFILMKPTLKPVPPPIPPSILQSTLQYGYEHFLGQVNLAEQLTSSDFGISTGLINQNYWESSKWYYVNVERGKAADELNGRNINVSLTLTFLLK